MIDEYIRQSRPEFDLEKATSLQELEERYQYVVHYGTWAMRGHTNPGSVFPTVDTITGQTRPRAIREDSATLLFPRFRRWVAGLGSEVIRFLMSNLAPREYHEYLNVYKALAAEEKMEMSEPTFSTLFVLDVNSFTGRHEDETDVKQGFGGLVGLDDYTGEHLCFPQLALSVPYELGDAVLFRGAELEHSVSRYTGYRIFMLYINHQPVRNYAHCKMGKLAPLPNDLWNPRRMAKMVEDEINVNNYDPCDTEPLSPEPEELREVDIQGAAYLSKRRAWGVYMESSSERSHRSPSSEGAIVMRLEVPWEKKQKQS